MAAEIDLTSSIRRAEPFDVASIQMIDRQVYSRPWSEAMTVEQTTGRGRVHFVVEIDHRVVAHGGFAVMIDEAHVTSIAVAPQHQRRGHGSRLLRRLFDAAIANSCAAVTLEVRQSNAPAIGFYGKHGFRSTGLRPGYYQDNGEDAIIMWNHLARSETDGTS